MSGLALRFASGGVLHLLKRFRLALSSSRRRTSWASLVLGMLRTQLIVSHMMFTPGRGSFTKIQGAFADAVSVLPSVIGSYNNNRRGASGGMTSASTSSSSSSPSAAPAVIEINGASTAEEFVRVVPLPMTTSTSVSSARQCLSSVWGGDYHEAEGAAWWSEVDEDDAGGTTIAPVRIAPLASKSPSTCIPIRCTAPARSRCNPALTSRTNDEDRKICALCLEDDRSTVFLKGPYDCIHEFCQECAAPGPPEELQEGDDTSALALRRNVWFQQVMRQCPSCRADPELLRRVSERLRFDPELDRVGEGATSTTNPACATRSGPVGGSSSTSIATSSHSLSPSRQRGQGGPIAREGGEKCLCAGWMLELLTGADRPAPTSSCRIWGTTDADGDERENSSRRNICSCKGAESSQKTARNRDGGPLGGDEERFSADVHNVLRVARRVARSFVASAREATSPAARDSRDGPASKILQLLFTSIFLLPREAGLVPREITAALKNSAPQTASQDHARRAAPSTVPTDEPEVAVGGTTITPITAAIDRLTLELAALSLCTQPGPLKLEEKFELGQGRVVQVMCNRVNFGGVVFDKRKNRCIKFPGIPRTERLRRTGAAGAGEKDSFDDEAALSAALEIAVAASCLDISAYNSSREAASRERRHDLHTKMKMSEEGGGPPDLTRGADAEEAAVVYARRCATTRGVSATASACDRGTPKGSLAPLLQRTSAVRERASFRKLVRLGACLALLTLCGITPSVVFGVARIVHGRDRIAGERKLSTRGRVAGAASPEEADSEDDRGEEEELSGARRLHDARHSTRRKKRNDTTGAVAGDKRGLLDDRVWFPASIALVLVAFPGALGWAAFLMQLMEHSRRNGYVRHDFSCCGVSFGSKVVEDAEENDVASPVTIALLDKVFCEEHEFAVELRRHSSVDEDSGTYPLCKTCGGYVVWEEEDSASEA